MHDMHTMQDALTSDLGITRSVHEMQTCLRHCLTPDPSQQAMLQPSGGSQNANNQGPAHAGPVNIHDSVQRAMVQPSQNHRDPWFQPFFQQVLISASFPVS